MRKTFLIATVAALALTAPAQAERGGRGQDNEQAPKAQKAQRAQAQGGGQRAERAQMRAQAQPRAERQQRAFEMRAQAQPRRERAFEMRAQAQPRIERRQRAFENRVQVQDRGVERRARVLDNRARIETRRAQRQEEFTTRRIQRQEVQGERIFSKQLRQQERQNDRLARIQQRSIEPRAALRQQPVAVERQGVWRDLASRITRVDEDRRDRRIRTRLATIGTRVNPDWYSDYAPVRFAGFYGPTPDYYYRYDYDNGYLYRIDRDRDFVTGLFPILGGAYSVGRPLPFYTSSYYNVPYGYSSLYYDTPNSYYRYGDGAIYGVDPTTQLITGIVALLTGQNFGVGQMLPLGYDTYNVPYGYRDRFYDSSDMWYRYDDGYIYGVDPRSRLIETSYPVYSGYAVGSPWPSYSGYDYDYGVPGYYDDLYYSQPGYDYRYASGGIYQVDPKTQLVAALVALVTGQNFGVGQRLPLGYDAYNVPLGYRTTYYDTPTSWYRYADGRIYQVDPGTRIIRRVIVA